MRKMIALDVCWWVLTATATASVVFWDSPALLTVLCGAQLFWATVFIIADVRYLRFTTGMNRRIAEMVPPDQTYCCDGAHEVASHPSQSMSQGLGAVRRGGIPIQKDRDADLNRRDR